MRIYLGAALLALVLAVGTAQGADIVTVPTANQQKAGEVDVADYYISLDFPSEMPQFVRVQTLYVGVTDRIEIDLHRYDVDKSTSGSTIWIMSALLQKEDARRPAVVIGSRDLEGLMAKTSYYISAAKTLNPPAPGAAPKFPIWRLHVSLGTEDDSLLGETRHEGVFGGIQTLLTPKLGLVALHDGQDLITGLTYTPEKDWPTLKAGTYGDHWWMGANFTFNVK
jgi:hypothetical protein